jgi:hypothetical protein
MAAAQVPVVDHRYPKTSDAAANTWCKHKHISKLFSKVSQLTQVNNHLGSRQEDPVLEEWEKVRGDFLEMRKAEGFGCMELENFRALRERNIFRP